MQQYLTEQRVVYSAKSDTEKSFDFILPEYLPGVSRVVKAYTGIEKCVFSEISGIAETQAAVTISIIYISEYDGKIKSTSFTEQISIPMREPFGHSGEYTAVPSCFVSSVHAIPQSPRKITVRLTLQTSVNIYSESQTPIFSPDGNDGICTIRNSASHYRKKLIPETHFEQNEDISIDSTKSAISEIIHTDASFLSSGTTLSEGELKFNASIRLGILYASSAEDDGDDTAYSYLNTTINLADTLRCETLSSDDIAFIYIDIHSAEPSVSLDPYGDNRTVSISVKYSVTGFAFEKQEIEFVTDAFLEGCYTEPDFSSVTVDRIHSAISKKEIISQPIHADIREITAISAANATIQSVSIEHTQGQFFAAARCLTSILGTNLSGELSAIDVPVVLHIPLGGEALSASDTIPEAIISISGCNAVIKEGVLKLDFEVTVNGVFIIRESRNVVCSLSSDDTGKPCGRKGEIVIYYPSRGEDLWQISKKYRVSPQKICDANASDETSIRDKKTVIIP